MQLANLDRTLRPELDARVYRSPSPRPRQYPGNARFRVSSRDDAGETLLHRCGEARPDRNCDAIRTYFSAHHHKPKP